jgi:chemotaxis protein methyltransferase CheR
MQDADCVAFLQWALPRLRYRWPGFRKVRGQVCKRIKKRLRELNLPDLTTYRHYLESHEPEWSHLENACRITISRFYRDRGVFDFLSERVLPDLARRALAEGETELRLWSVGAASGEEPFTLSLIWQKRLQPAFPDLACRILATEKDSALIERARTGVYRFSSLKDLPRSWIEEDFQQCAEGYRLHPRYQGNVAWRQQDLRDEAPEGTFHLILCRNLAFTYFEAALQAQILERLHTRLTPCGILGLGIHEFLPAGSEAWEQLDPHQPFYRRLK